MNSTGPHGWRIGILAGTGTALKRIIPALLESQVCRVTVVHGRDRERLNEVARLDARIRLATSERDFISLRDHYDVVFIGSPPFLHLQHLNLVAESGLPVICEKPLIARRQDLPKLLQLAGAGRMRLAVAHQIRHQPAVGDIATLLRTNRLGSPVAVDMRWCFRMDYCARNALWKLRPELGGSSAMFDCGVHVLDLALFLFGRPDCVGGMGYHVRSGSVYDCVSAILGYPQFAVNVVASQSGAAVANDLRITFSDCILLARNLFGERAVDAVDIVGDGAIETWQYDPEDLYRAEIEELCQSLESPASAAIGTDEALTTTRVLFALEDALERRQIVYF